MVMKPMTMMIVLGICAGVAVPALAHASDVPVLHAGMEAELEACPIVFDLPLRRDQVESKAGYRSGLPSRISCGPVKIVSLLVLRKGKVLEVKPMFSLAKGRDYLSEWIISVRQNGTELCKARSGAHLDEGEISWEDPVKVFCGDEKLGREGLVLRVEVALTPD